MRKWKVLFILILAIVLFLINFIGGYFSKRVDVYVTNKVSVYGQQIFEQALREEVVSTIDTESLVYFHKDTDNNIKSIYINTKTVNNILSNVSLSLNNNIKKLTNEKLSLPFGIIISETLFYNLGPNIDINITPIGNIKTDIVSIVKPYGINSSLLEIGLKIDMNFATIIPLKKNVTNLNFVVPIVIEIINGEVPRYYYNTNDVIPFINYD